MSKTASSEANSAPARAEGGGIGPGARLGRYELRERIGAGGMSEVYRALQHVPGGLKRSVVVKLIRPDRLAEPGAEERFLDEARNSLGLQHPHIVAVHDFGREQGQWFLVLEEVSGPSLAALLVALARVSAPMAEDEALLIAADLAAALEHVHGQVDETGRLLGLVHRDLCAANVLLSRRAEAKLGDFGVSRVAGAGQPIEGHLATMAPEQLSGGAVGPPADVWALGVVLWEMLTGRRLFPQNSVSEQLSVVRAGPLPAPSTRRAGLRPGLDALLSLMLEADPRLRPSAAAVHVELMGLLGSTLAPRLALAERLAQLFPLGPEPLGRGEPSPGPTDEAAATVMISRPPSVSGPAAAPLSSPEAAGSTGSLQLPPRRLRALLPVVIASAFVVIGASAWVLRGQGPVGAPAPAAAPSEAPSEAPPSAPAATAPPTAPPPTAAPAAPAEAIASAAPAAAPPPISPPAGTPTTTSSTPTSAAPQAPSPAPAAHSASAPTAAPAPTARPAPPTQTTPAPTPSAPPAAPTPAAAAAADAPAAAPAVGVLDLRVEGDFAWFTVDGRRGKKASRSLHLELSPGKHLIQAELRTTGKVLSREVEIVAGEAQTLSLGGP